jgi:hypothetical protein
MWRWLWTLRRLDGAHIYTTYDISTQDACIVIVTSTPAFVTSPRARLTYLSCACALFVLSRSLTFLLSIMASRLP